VAGTGTGVFIGTGADSGTGATTGTGTSNVVGTESITGTISSTGTVGGVSTGTGTASNSVAINIGLGGVIVVSGKRLPLATSRASLATLNPFLQQAKVSILANDECRMDPIIGQYVIDTNICVSSPEKFTCLVSQQLTIKFTS
jgi:hypothetical protein